MKEKIPCGGFYYDTESIEFDNGIMKAKGGNTKLSPFVTIGTSTAGFTEQDVDFLCDGTNDAEVIQNALDIAAENDKGCFFFQGEYDINSGISIGENVLLKGINFPVLNLSSKIHINGDNVCIDGLKIINKNVDNSIVFNHANDFTIQNSILKSSSPNILYGTYSNNHQCINSYINGNILYNNCNGMTIRNNKIGNNIMNVYKYNRKRSNYTISC